MCKQHSNVLRRQESIIIGYFWFSTFFFTSEITFHYVFICNKINSLEIEKKILLNGRREAM